MVNNNDELKKALDEVTPQILVDAIDELLLLQLGKENGYHLSDEQFKAWLDNLRKEQNLDRRSEVPGGAEAGRHDDDDLRKNVEKQILVEQVQRDEVGSKLAITEEEARQYYLTHKNEFAEPRDRDAARDPHRGAVDDQGRPVDDQRREAGRGGAEGGGAAHARPGRRGLRQGRGGSLGVAVEGQRRPDRSDQPRRSVAVAAGHDFER